MRMVLVAIGLVAVSVCGAEAAPARKETRCCIKVPGDDGIGTRPYCFNIVAKPARRGPGRPRQAPGGSGPAGSPDSGQARTPDRFQEIDLEFKRREGFAFFKISRISHPHGGVGNVTEDAAVQRPHRVGVRCGCLKFDDRFTGFY